MQSEGYLYNPNNIRFFLNMFWKQINTSSPQIDAVLSKENVTLHDLMDEEDILQECKSQNKNLMEFLVRPEIMEELVTLTTVEPSTELDEKARYKYPNIACELLTSDVPALNNRLANDDSLLEKLYNFIESNPPLNPLLASYFTKTLSMLVSQRSEQDWYSYQVTCLQVLEFLMSKENFVPLLIRHMGTSAIMDLMLKLVSNIEAVEINQHVLKWLNSEQVVQSLVGLLNPAVDAERQCNAAQLLSDIIVNSRDSTINPINPIITTLESSATVTLLLNHILGSVKTECSIVSGIQVLLALLNFKKNNAASDINEQVEIPAEKEHRETVIQTTISSILEHLKDFHDILLDPPKKPAVLTTMGKLDPPFGNTRLQVSRLLVALLATDNPELKKEMIRLGTVKVLLDLFFKYTWNNFLHTQVQQCIALAISPTTKSEDPSENPMYPHLILDCRLLGRILEAWDDNEIKQAQTGGIRQGYMGHLINIANNIVDKSETTPLGSYIKTNVGNDTIVSWETFVNGPLSEINKTKSIVLGGVFPSNSAGQENQDDYCGISFHDQQVDSDFQGVPTLNSQLSDSYEFNDEDSRAEWFDRICAETISTFDGHGDGNDDWLDQNHTTSPERDERRLKWMSQRRSLSDEEPNPLDKMDLDSSNPWKTAEDVPEYIIAPVTSADPWSTNQNTPVSSAQDNWADFTSASFGNFEESSNQSPDETPASNVEVTEQPLANTSATNIELKEVLPEDKDNDNKNELEKNNLSPKPESKNFNSDDNANISNTINPNDEIIDIFRAFISDFRSTDELNTSTDIAPVSDTELVANVEIEKPVTNVEPSTETEAECSESTPTPTPTTPLSNPDASATV